MSSLAKAHRGPPDLAIILGAHKGGPDDGDEAEGAGPEDDEHEGAKKDAMAAFIKALEDKDTEAALEAYDTLHDLKESEDDEDEEGEEHDDEED